MKLKLKTLLLTLIISLSGCHSITVVTEALPRPDALVIPDNLRISHEEWFCLGKQHEDIQLEKARRVECSAYIKVVKRDKLKSARIDTLDGIIGSTHKQGE